MTIRVLFKSQVNFLRLRKAGYDFKVAINTDFISPSYDGDDKKYIYTGAARKKC